MTVAAIDDEEIDKTVEEKVSMFARKLDGNGSSNEKGAAFGSNALIAGSGGTSASNKGQIAVMFYERRAKSHWFSKSEEEVCWEQWAITVTALVPTSEGDRQRLRNMTAKQLQSRLYTILGVASENKSHIPPIVSHEGNPFPFQIAIPTPSESWSSMLRRIVDAGGNGGGTVGVANVGQGGEYA